jgi:predicted GNAT family acetyltransferase
MIRQIKSTEDIHQAIVLLKEFVQETVYRDHQNQINEMHLGKMVHMVMHHHYAWLAELNDEPVGLLLAVKEPNMWAPGQKQMRELVWYVRPEHRTGAIAGRLFLKYCQVAESLLEQGQIAGFFTSTQSTTQDINLERRGFKLVEKTFLKEH